jgi:hypothetical protein
MPGAVLVELKRHPERQPKLKPIAKRWLVVEARVRSGAQPGRCGTDRSSRPTAADLHQFAFLIGVSDGEKLFGEPTP